MSCKKLRQWFKMSHCLRITVPSGTSSADVVKMVESKGVALVIQVKIVGNDALVCFASLHDRDKVAEVLTTWRDVDMAPQKTSVVRSTNVTDRR